MTGIRPKKQLGQHFLADPNIARKIVNSLTYSGDYARVLEIGPGTGILTKSLLSQPGFETWAIELDGESVAYLQANYPAMKERILYGDFLKFRPGQYFTGAFAVIGNFPYNISSQIFFHILEFRDLVPEVVCMLQKEVAQRIASPPGSKRYGILSVLLQAWYDTELLFDVPPHVFIPPPNVQSSVLRLKRNDTKDLGCDHELFVKVVRAGFNLRRKTLRNALKVLGLPAGKATDGLFDKRAEQLSVSDFIALTKIFQDNVH